MNLREALQPRSSILTRLAMEDDRSALLNLFRLHLARVSPQLEFDGATASETFDNYLQTANPTIYVAEDGDRRVIGYLMATFNQYAASAGYYVCAEEMYAPISAVGIEVAEALGAAFEAWAEQLNPAPLEIMLGIDIELASLAGLPQHKGGR